MKIVDRLLRPVLTGVYYFLRAAWFVRRPKTYGAHAVALTPEGKVILVKLRYAPGWRLPGGGRTAEEPPVDAVLRELREEIGLLSHIEPRPVGDFEKVTDFKRDTASVIIVRDVRYRPRWNLEVEEVLEADIDALPADMSPLSRSWIEVVRPLL